MLLGFFLLPRTGWKVKIQTTFVPSILGRNGGEFSEGECGGAGSHPWGNRGSALTLAVPLLAALPSVQSPLPLFKLSGANACLSHSSCILPPRAHLGNYPHMWSQQQEFCHILKALAGRFSRCYLSMEPYLTLGF